MTILVTGGTGFIGSHLIDKLVVAGHRVVAPVRKMGNVPFFPSDCVKIIDIDLLDCESVKKIFKGVDVVFHLASIRGKGWSFEDQDVFRINVGITENLLRVSSLEGIKHFIYVSSVSVYGHPIGGPIGEGYPSGPATRYGRTKYESERLVEAFHREKGTPATIVRPVITYGPRDTWGMIPQLIALINSRRYLTVGDGNNRVHLLYVDDLIDGLMLVIKNQTADGKAYIFAGEGPITINRLVEIISSVLNKNAPNFHVPLWFAESTAYLLEAFYKLLSVKKEPFITLDKIDTMCRDRFFNISLAKEDLGFMPKIDYEEGLRKTVNWLRGAKLILG